MTSSNVARPAIQSGPVEQVSDAELARYAELIYKRTGIRVSPQKKMLLSNRIRRRLRETGIEGFSQYFKHLKALAPKDPEWDAFLQEITTHETYLFRDESHWDWFRNSFLAEIAANTRSSGGKRALRIWSSACSTGDEAYTTACCIAACLPNRQGWMIQITGTDIGVGALEQARQGAFGQRAMQLVPEEYRRRFFKKANDAEVWQAKPALREMVTFRQHNLMEPIRAEPFDLVFLKNVLIYFDAASKKQVMSNVRSAIRAGGLLLAGAAEGVSDLLKDFVRVHPWLYRKP